MDTLAQGRRKLLMRRGRGSADLCEARDPEVLVWPHGAFGGVEFAAEQFHEGGFARPVRPDESDAALEIHPKLDTLVEKIAARISEAQLLYHENRCGKFPWVRKAGRGHTIRVPPRIEP